ncbi:MAG: IS200/IS605 family transposase [Aureliella sp.]
MSQSLAKVYLHVVFSTKNRQPTLLPAWRDELFQVLGGLTNNLGCQSLVVGGVEDHVHTLFTLSRTATISDAVKKLKASSSAWVNETHAPRTPFHWQAGYAAFSVSQSSVENVRHYIERQPEHHNTRSFQDEMRDWFTRYEIDWDERYVWD